MNKLIAAWPPIFFTSIGVMIFFLIESVFSFALLIPIFLGFADINSRIMDYKKVLKQLKGGHAINIHVEYQYSFCRRQACKKAFYDYEPAFGRIVKKSFKSMGYRWYHIFPKHTFSKKSPYLKFNFYRNLICGMD